MEPRFTDTSLCTVRRDVDLNAAGNIAQDGETATGKKTFSFPMFNSQLVVATIGNTQAFGAVSQFIHAILNGIGGATDDELSTKASIELVTE